MLEYTLDGSATAPAASTALSWDHFQWRLEEFLKEGQPSSTSFDQMCDWINVSIFTGEGFVIVGVLKNVGIL
jgi:hypothetical protein